MEDKHVLKFKKLEPEHEENLSVAAAGGIFGGGVTPNTPGKSSQKLRNHSRQITLLIKKLLKYHAKAYSTTVM